MMRAAMLSPAVLVCAACVETAQSRSVSDMAARPVSIEGVDYQVTGGANLRVSGLGVAMGFDQGRVAKRIAMTFCADQNKTLNPLALGAFVSGSWVFSGGCQ